MEWVGRQMILFYLASIDISTLDPAHIMRSHNLSVMLATAPTLNAQTLRLNWFHLKISFHLT